MPMRWSRFGAIVIASAWMGAVCMAPAQAKPAQPPVHKTAQKSAGQGTHARKAPVRPAVAAGAAKKAAKAPRTPVRATAGGARKAGKAHALAARPGPRAVPVQRKPTATQRAKAHRAARPVAAKKSLQSPSKRLRPGSRPVAKAHGAAMPQRVARKPPARRPGHKKTAH